ncbi:3-hydroxyacyl-CoA dehydrogenase NAD-binding domain-containing protein [Oleiharenicola lentus]|uniref:3-hydroxyacyl-CoA dehydrogenase NAD-binding domain-containing protein n=1 Tax=Oleiharenicola lentus TaxID=2508720 RepID=UPI003F6772AC
MKTPDQIHRVAIVGTGLIGSSWAAFYLARGLTVIATDPAPDAEQKLRHYIDHCWPVLEQLGLSPGASRERLHFTSDLNAAIEKADFVQENGPEREEFKVQLFARMDAVAPADVILASSTSGLAMTAIQRDCAHPGRCVVGHPFNPPHLIPLVEVVGGQATSPDTIESALNFYRRCGKHPIHIKKEIPGHVANRLQAALWREAVHLVNEGVATVSDVDAAVSWGPGLRWGLMGPHLILHLGGGQGGMSHFLDHLAGPFSRWWQDLGSPELTPEVQAKLIAGVNAEAAGRSINELEAERNRLLLGLLKLRRHE